VSKKNEVPFFGVHWFNDIKGYALGPPFLEPTGSMTSRGIPWGLHFLEPTGSMLYLFVFVMFFFIFFDFLSLFQIFPNSSVPLAQRCSKVLKGALDSKKF
jgi:hypothetical protein